MSTLTNTRRRIKLARDIRVLVERWAQERGATPQSGLRYWQEQTLDVFLLLGVALGSLTLVPGVSLAFWEHLYAIGVMQVVLFLAALLLLVRRDFSYAVRATGAIVLCFLIGITMLLAPGPFNGAPVWLFVPPVFAGILGDRKSSLLALLANAAILLTLGLLAYHHVLVLPQMEHIEARWLVFFLNFMLLDTLATIGVAMIIHGLEGTLVEELEVRKSLREKNFELSVAHERLEVEIARREQVEAQLRDHRDHLEALVAQRTADLRFRNEEIRAFTYSVSHDLRSPLRAIAGFGEILIEEHGAELDTTGRDYLERMCAAARQMDRLIDGMLWLSRSSRADMHYETVDISELAADIVSDLRRQDPDRQVEVKIAPAILAQGDRALLGSALENLLGNAWKFTGCREQGRIELGVAANGTDPTYFVRDNGVGFDMRFVGKLFGVFQRLHGKNEFPGTGIGLALVQRIVERHGGHVWAMSEIDKGATFYFSLPACGNGTTEAQALDEAQPQAQPEYDPQQPREAQWMHEAYSLREARPVRQVQHA